MRIEVRLFANLRTHLPAGSPRGRCVLEVPDGTTIAAALARLDVPLTSAQIALVNGEHERDFDRALLEGDTLSIFPPVAGG